MTDDKTAPFTTDAATLTAITHAGLSAGQIVHWLFCVSAADPCNAVQENFDAVRGVAELTPGTTIGLVNGVAGYVLVDQPLPVSHTSVALFGAGVVNVNNGAVWGLNTTIGDCEYRQDCSATATGRQLYNEFDLSFSSTHSIGTGLNLGGNSVVTPQDSTGIGLTYLDGNNQGAVAKWGRFLGSQEGSTNVFLYASTQARNTGTTTADSQEFQFGAYAAGVGTVGKFHFGSDSLFHFNNPITATGISNGSNAAVSQVGEYIASTILSASAIGLGGSGTATTVTSISLTPGDWDVYGNVSYNLNGATVTAAYGAVNNSTAFPDGSLYAQVGPITANTGFVAPSMRYNLTATTTIDLLALGVYSVATPKVSGQIWARRVR